MISGKKCGINEARFPWLGFFGRDIPEKPDSVSGKLKNISVLFILAKDEPFFYFLAFILE
ncbi:MAG: hypothetical protein K5757_12995 [Bacteroidaceae bacterium]|nr:hypothetical protein [Bacteroidaceae bacterium]